MTPVHDSQTIALSMRASNTLRLSREVRVPLRPFAGADWFCEMCLRVTISGALQEDTGFLVDANQLDNWVLAHIELSPDATLADVSPSKILTALWSRLSSNPLFGLNLEELDLRFSPTWHWTTFADDATGKAVQLLTRDFHFCAAHRLHNPVWSDEQNRAVFGPCNNAAGHGHNYRLEVAVTADARWEEVEEAVREQVHTRLDHRHLNVDVPELQGINPTVEALTNFIWNALEAALPQGWLQSVRLHETPKIASERRRSGKKPDLL